MVPDVVHDGDPRMLQPRPDPRLSAESGHDLLIHLRAQKDLDGDRPIQREVVTPPHLAHPPAADSPVQLIAPHKKIPSLHTHLKSHRQRHFSAEPVWPVACLPHRSPTLSRSWISRGRLGRAGTQ